MSSFCIVMDSNRCIACQACVAHCKIKNAMPEGIFLNRLISTEPHMEEGKCVIKTEYQTCFHCENAWCMDICPSHAIQRDDHGAVWIDAALCIGCGLCAKACPWHMVQMMKVASTAEGTKSKRLAVKCDHCRDLRREDLQPACVTACTAHALQYMQLCDAPAEYQEAYAQRMESTAST